jgi:hypothetical protein
MTRTKVKDLKYQLGAKGPRPMLYCEQCGNETSAHKGDYFDCSPETILKCCEEPLHLGIKRVVYEPV